MVYFFIILILFSPIDRNQADTLNFDSQITVVDSVEGNEVSQKTSQAYQEILEKTNQQLSLWWNPFGLMIAGLGVLFTILTIIAAAIIFFQGRAAKQLLNNSIERHTKILNEYIDQKNKEMKSLIDKYSQDIKELKEKTPESDDRDEYLKKLNELEKSIEKLSKQDFKNYINRTNEFMDINLSDSELSSSKFVNIPIGDLRHECSKCGHSFFIPSSGLSLSGMTRPKCPNCGNIDAILT